MTGVASLAWVHDWGDFWTWRNKWNGAAQGDKYDLLLWWGSVVYITSEQKDCTARFAAGCYMRVSRLKSKSGSSTHTGGSVQGRAALLYSMFLNTTRVVFVHNWGSLGWFVYKVHAWCQQGKHFCTGDPSYPTAHNCKGKKILLRIWNNFKNSLLTTRSDLFQR